MKKLATLIVALALVASLASAFPFVMADEDPIRVGEPNTPATMVANKWFKVGYDRDGNMLNPSTLIHSQVTRQEADGTGYRLFPWQKSGEQTWGRASDDYGYELPRLIPTNRHDWLGRFDESNYDFDYDHEVNQYAWWTEIFLNVEPSSGNSQEFETAHWYAVVDREGSLWLDPDGKFHNCGTEITADPMFYIAGTNTYAEGSCRDNPRALIDPIPINNTQGPYNLRFDREDTASKLYFWWKYDRNRNLVDRVWRVGWADMNDYDPVPNPEYGWDPADSNTWSTIGFIPTYDPYTQTNIPDADVDWDCKLAVIPFQMSEDPTWPNVTQGTECYADRNGNGYYDPYEPIYRKGDGNLQPIVTTVQTGDIRLTNVSTSRGNYKINYRVNEVVTDNDFDNGWTLLPFMHMNPPANYPVYVHSHDQNPDEYYDFGEFIYQKSATAEVRLNTWLTVATVPGTNIITVANDVGADVGDTIYIEGDMYGQTEERTITAILGGGQLQLNSPISYIHSVLRQVAELIPSEIGDIRLSNVNTRHNNNPVSWDWFGGWWHDAILMFEVLQGGCFTPKYNITVETDLWDGMVPSVTAAALRSPNGDIMGAAQRIQKTTVLDPTGLEFRVPATTFEDIKLEYREYIGLEIFRDDGINNNLGDTPVTTNVIRGTLADDYIMYEATEDFVGSVDEEIAKDYHWSIATLGFSADERFVDLNLDTQLGAGEPMYRDTDLSDTVTEGDIRITDVVVETNIGGTGGSIVNYGAGSRVTQGDVDIGHFAAVGELIDIPVSVRFKDLPHGCIPENRQYDIGEPIYYNPALGSASTVQMLYANDFTDPVGNPMPNVNGWDPANWMEIDETNSGLPSGQSVEDPFGLMTSPNEVLWNYDAANQRAELQSGQNILVPSMGVGTIATFEYDFRFAPDVNNNYYNSFGTILRWNSPTDYYVLMAVPHEPGNPYATVFNRGDYGQFYGWGVPAGSNEIQFFLMHFDGSAIAPIVASSSTIPWVFNTDMYMHMQIAINGQLTTITANGVDIFPGGIPAANTYGAFGFTHLGSSYALYGWFQDSAWIDNILLYRTTVGSSLGTSNDLVRVVDVYVNGTFYPAGSRVTAGDFYRVKNPVNGISMGGNCSMRYMDVEVLPGDIGLNVEIDGKLPTDKDYKGLKVEKTSHVKVSLNYELEGEYLTGPVIGDKRTRLYYKPDSFFVRTIPVDKQVKYSSPQEAQRNFYTPHQSIEGDVVYVNLRGPDYNIYPYTSTVQNGRLYEVNDFKGIIDAKNPVLEFEYTPYSGTILDDLGQDLPYMLYAFVEKGGIDNAPIDSRFTYALTWNNSADRTIDPAGLQYSDYNYVDPWHAGRKWEMDEAYANYYNQAYTRACRTVYNPYMVQNMSECGLADKYDCYGIEKLHVAPEGIEIVPSSPCVDPLSYRYPNISLKLNAYDNPDDVNDPEGYTMAVAPTDANGQNHIGVATYNVNGAGIRYMATIRYWNMPHTVDQDAYFILQVNDDGSWLGWNWGETNYPGIIDPTDVIQPFTVYPFGRDLNNRGSDAHDVGDNDCSVGTGTVDLCGSGFPPLGDVTFYDTYGPTFCDPQWGTPPYYGMVYHYGVRTLISAKTATEEGGTIAVVCQPMHAKDKLNIRVHTSNMVVDYNSSSIKVGNNAVYFTTDRANLFQASDGTIANNQYDPSMTLGYAANPPGVRNLPWVETVDYCDVISLKVLPPDSDLNFNNFYIVDHALQYSEVSYTGAQGSGALVELNTPDRWITPRYNPLCVLRPLSHDENTDVRCYPGGQTHLIRVENSMRGAGYNATPALWRKQFNKLGSEFYGLTDYGMFFELTNEDYGYWGVPLTFASGLVKRLEITGPFMTPLDLDPEFSSIKYRSGTAAGSALGYSYKGLRFVPIKYDYSGQIIVDRLNYLAYELGQRNYTYITSPGCTTEGDFVQFSGSVNPYLNIGKELDYRYVTRPTINGRAMRVLVFDELIPIGPGRIDITVWLTDGTKKIFQDCCVEPPANGVDVAGIKIEGMPHMITVDEETILKLKLTEGYGIESEGPPPEYGKGIQEYRECNDALVYVWQDRGIFDPVEKLYSFAGDGYCSMAPQSTDYTDLGVAYTEDDDLNNDSKISFDAFETEIMGSYDLATNTWVGGLIDARTFHRQNGEYIFSLSGAAMPTTVGIDFGSKGIEAEPDHVIGDDETLDIHVTAYKYGDDNNSRSFRPFWGGREINTERAFSHEVYLAGQKSAYVEAKEDLMATVTPAVLTAGCTPELIDPTAPLTFEVKWPDGTPLDLSVGVEDPLGGDEVKIDDAWIHLFKDPHPDDQYYYPGELLPQYYWLRTDLHNEDFSQIGNTRMYSFNRYPFLPITFGWNPAEGVYVFKGFAANDKGSFDVHIYSPDRRHKAIAEIVVESPIVDYEISPRDFYTNAGKDPLYDTGSDDDFVMTGADFKWYFITATMKTAEGNLIQGLAESTSTCLGGEGMNARFTPFYTREEHYNWVTPPSATLQSRRRYSGHAAVYNYYLSDSRGSRERQIMLADLNGNGTFGDLPEEFLIFGRSDYSDLGIRVGGKTGPGAPFYPTVNSRFDDETYNYWNSWDGPFDKPSAGPAGYGVGSIYNDEKEGLYVFADSNRDFQFTYQDSFNIDNRGQGTFAYFADDKCKIGVMIGVTDHAMTPKFGDIYGGSDPYTEFSPQRTATRFVHILTGNEELGTGDGAYSLDWDAIPDNVVNVEYMKVVTKWAETKEEISKDMLDADNYDLAYGVENHIWFEFYPADNRDFAVTKDAHVAVMAAGDVLHPWGGPKSESFIVADITASPINPSDRVAQLYITPTGTGPDVTSLRVVGSRCENTADYARYFYDNYTTWGAANFDVIMSIQIVVDTMEALKVGVPGTLVVSALKTAGGEPIEGATVHIKGAGVEVEKKTRADGSVEFNITPTERGRILVTAEAEGMKGAYTTAFVETYVAPPKLDLDPIPAIVSTDTVTVKGRTNEGTKITVNGRPVSVSQDGTFTYTLRLEPGKNSVIVVATNSVGQTQTKVVDIESRMKASEIIIDPVGEYCNVTSIRIRGHVEPGNTVKVTSVTLGREFDAIVTNDTFICDIDVQAGVNEITVVATDLTTNKESDPLNVSFYIWTRVDVLMYLNGNQMIVDSVPQRIDVPPTEINGVTMIPFDPIANAFGIGVVPAGDTITATWGTNTLILTRGNSKAVLNNEAVDLVTAPVIENGALMIALDDVKLLKDVNGDVVIDMIAASGQIVISKKY